MKEENRRAWELFKSLLGGYVYHSIDRMNVADLSRRIKIFEEAISESGVLGSPIEALAFGPLCLVDQFGIMVPRNRWQDGNIYVECQSRIGEYRVDFLFTRQGPNAKRLVVECDGHAFHERTKDQATRDKARDRWLLQNGYHVMRFTGSEIFQWHEVVMFEACGFFGITGSEPNVEA